MREARTPAEVAHRFGVPLRGSGTPQVWAAILNGVFLAIDAATAMGSAALITSRGELLAECTVAMKGRNEEALMPAVARLLLDTGVEGQAVAGVISGAGPGSFTSLRIAGAICKGLAHAWGVPMYSVSSLLLVVASFADSAKAGRYLAALDALRGEFFTQCCEVAGDGSVYARGNWELTSADNLRDAAAKNGAAIAGPGQNIDAAPHARGAARLLTSIIKQGGVDLAMWEPDYGRLAEAERRLLAANGISRA